VLEKVLLTLGALVTGHKEQQSHDENVAAAEWLQERLKATQLKLQVLECQFVEATHTKAANHAFRAIAAHLDTALAQAKLSHERAVARCRQYEAVGLGFDVLAREYSAIAKECAHKEWALRELQELGREI